MATLLKESSAHKNGENPDWDLGNETLQKNQDLPGELFCCDFISNFLNY
jgi:hypothetical protein